MQQRPSERIEFIRAHVVRVRYLAGEGATAFAIVTYLDEQRGFYIPDNHPLRLAEQAAGMPPLALA